jgi:hypothetical protein
MQQFWTITSKKFTDPYLAMKVMQEDADQCLFAR